MKKRFVLFPLCLPVFYIFVTSIVLFSCSKYDDGWVKKATEDFEKRISALEEWQKSINTEIISLQGVIRSINEKDFVTKVASLADGSGYVISFEKGGDITIKNGKDGVAGDKGDSPVIGVKQDSDGIYYWTLNGEWLLNEEDRIKVTGDKGEDALAPQVRINENTFEWENLYRWRDCKIKCVN